MTIVGLGEDGPEGLSLASQKALTEAEIVMGPPRHLALLPGVGQERVEWPVPFADGLDMLDGLRGRTVAILASGDPFWFGVGRTIANRLSPNEWRAFPGPSCFSLAAAALGWGIETTTVLALHAAPLSRLRPHLAPGARAIVTLKDGAAVAELALYLTKIGFGDSTLSVFEALGGPRERRTETLARDCQVGFRHPVCAAIAVAGDGAVVTAAPGRADGLFLSDGVMTKRSVRALTLSALAPRPYERLWDIGGGSGTVAIEWLWAHPTTQAISIEPRPDRTEIIRRNALTLGVDRLVVVEGDAPDALGALEAPNAVFIGGGLSDALLDRLWELPEGTRIVANAVTLESEAVLIAAQGRFGGDLLRIALSEVAPIGPRQGWKSAYPIVQWSAIR